MDHQRQQKRESILDNAHYCNYRENFVEDFLVMSSTTTSPVSVNIRAWLPV